MARQAGPSYQYAPGNRIKQKKQGFVILNPEKSSS